MFPFPIISNTHIPAVLKIKDLQIGGSSSSTTLILLSDGRLYGSGANGTGELGLGNTTTYYRQLLKLRSDVRLISCGTHGGTMIVTLDNKVFYSGACYINGTRMASTTWTNISSVFTTLGINISTIKSIQNDLNVLVLLDDGRMYGGGYNRSGALGLGDELGRTFRFITSNVSTIYTTSDNTCYIGTNGVIHGAGINTSNQLGISSTASQLTYIELFNYVDHELYPLKSLLVSSTNIIYISTGTQYYCQGKNLYGKFGNGAADANYTLSQGTLPAVPSTASIDTDKSALYNTFVVGSNNTMYSTGWGNESRNAISTSNISTFTACPTPSSPSTIEGVRTGWGTSYYWDGLKVYGAGNPIQFINAVTKVGTGWTDMNIAFS